MRNDHNPAPGVVLGFDAAASGHWALVGVTRDGDNLVFFRPIAVGAVRESGGVDAPLSAGGRERRSAEAGDILDVIDRATDGVCPCGAPPADGSAYCGDDCRPTHIAEHTDVEEFGDYATPMRWRPDLVSAASDEGLTPVAGPFQRGRFTGQMFDRAGGVVVHLRLDDGHRFVGVDVPKDGEDLAGRCEAAWERLERELVNPRRTLPGDAEWLRRAEAVRRREEAVRRSAARQAVRWRVCEWLRANGVDPGNVVDRSPIITTRSTVTVCEYAPGSLRYHPWPLVVQRIVPLVVPWPDDLQYEHHFDAAAAAARVRPLIGWNPQEAFYTTAEARARLDEARQAVADHLHGAIREAAESWGRACQPFIDGIRALAQQAPQPPEWSMLRAIEARRNRNTGPQPRQRPPRRIDPTRSR